MAKGITNRAKEKIHLNSFIGGQSIDYKYGIANSFYSSQSLDFRQKASQMSVLPGASALSSSLSDLITAMVQDKSGNRYAVGNAGHLYRINNSGVISQIGVMNQNGAAGIVYNQQSDQVYIAGQNTISMYGQVSGTTPTLRLDQFGPNASIGNGVIYTFNSTTDSYDGGVDSNAGINTIRNNLNSVGTYQAITPSNYSTLVTNTLTNTYVVPSGLSEATGQTCPFVPDITPFYSIAIYLTAVGTGNLTLTLHDSLNNSLATKTINNGSLVVGWNNFVFTNAVNVIPNAIATGSGAAYHFHLSSSVSSDTTAVATIVSGSLTGANFVLFANRLINTNNGWHPMVLFGQTLCIGNGPYLATYNFLNDSSPTNTQFIRHQIPLDFGYEVTSLAINNQYLVIAAEKRSTGTSNSYQDGFLYFWDGQNSGYNFKIEIPMGAPYSLQTINNVTYFICSGSLFAWGGGQQVIKVRYLAYQNTDYLGSVDKTVVNPNMMDIRYNLLMIGYPSTTTNVNLNYGVYSWGSVELSYPNSFGYSYPLSISSTAGSNYSSSNNMQFGMVKNFVDTMYMSWQYTDSSSVTHYGLDIVNNSSSPASTFSWQSLIYDGGARYKTKLALRLRINFLPLPSGATLTANYTLDRGTTVSSDPVSGISFSASTGDTAITVELNNARFREAQWGFSGTCSSTSTAPVITGVTMEIDPLEDEIDIKNDRLN